MKQQQQQGRTSGSILPSIQDDEEFTQSRPDLDLPTVPPPSRPIKKESTKDCPGLTGYIRLQVCAGRGFQKGVQGKLEVQIARMKQKGSEKLRVRLIGFISFLMILQGKKVKLFTTTARRVDAPVWNEIYQINVCESDAEVLYLTVYSAHSLVLRALSHML